MHAALQMAEKVVEHSNELPFSPVVFGVAGFGGLAALLLVAYAFRSVGTRH